MAAILNITDGTTTVNLLSAKVDYQLRAEGYSQSDPEPNQIRRRSQFGEGESVILSNPNNVIETFTIAVYGASHDAIATNLQKLATLQRQAKEFETTRWQTAVVYMTAKTENETNTRYARVIQIRVTGLSPLFSSIFNSQNALSQATILVERVPYWEGVIPRSALPTALTIGAPQAPGTQADATEQFIANYRDIVGEVIYIFNYDDSAGTFSANLASSSSFSYFPAVPALNDIVYFGATIPWHHLVLNIGSVGSFVFTVTWEWWNGSAWVSTAGGIQTNTLTFTTSSLTGANLIVIDTPVGWTFNTVNGVPEYWIRARISAFTSWTSSPTQTGQVVYSPHDTYISVAADQIDGDVDAIAMLRYFMKVNTNADLSWMALGIKSRGLSTFLSRINCGSNNPAAWTIANGTDTTTVADIAAPGGDRASCTFATNLTMVARVTVTTTTNANIKDMEGEYHAYVRCQQSSGAGVIGDVSIKLRLTYLPTLTVDTPTVALRQKGTTELVSLGRVSILPAQIIAAADTASLSLSLSVWASALSADPDLYIYDIVLIPIDEMAMVASASGSASQAIVDRNQGLDIDGGLFRTGPVQKGANGEAADAIVSMWEQRGDLLRFPVDKAFRIYFLMAEFDTAFKVHYPHEYFAGSFKAYTHERWVFMRGSE